MKLNKIKQRGTIQRLLQTIAASAVFAVTTALPVHAQDAYPSQPIKLIVPFAPGGATDVIGRLMAERLGDTLNGTVVVENRPGVGSILGTDVAARSKPDGYTLVMSNGSAITTGPYLRANMPYEVLDDFIHVFMIGTFPNAFVVRSENSIKTFSEFVSMARSNPDAVNFSSAGVGSVGFLTGEMLRQTGNMSMLHVPYKGTAPATVDLLGGRLDALFDGLPTAAAQAKSGNVRILAVTGANRVPAFPDVPTMSEVIPGIVGEAWFGISVPAKTPVPIVEKLETALAQIVAEPAVQKRLTELGMVPMGLNHEDFLTFLQSESERWGPIIKAANIQID